MPMIWVFIALGAVIWVYLLTRTYLKKASDVPAWIELPDQQLGKNVGVHSIQGARTHMEDYYYVDSTKNFFAVYDGHGGARCAQFVMSTLHRLLFEYLPPASEHQTSSASTREDETEKVKAALVEAFTECDRQWLKIADSNRWEDGSTVICAYIRNGILYVANVGDCRAIVCQNGKFAVLSDDHKPNRADERKRIEGLGGRVIHFGIWRVEGILAITRAIGDRKLKKYVSCEPEIKNHRLTAEDRYLLLASDGVWDVLENDEVESCVTKMKDVAKAAKRITNLAYENKSMDNITTMVIDLQAFR